MSSPFTEIETNCTHVQMFITSTCLPPFSINSWRTIFHCSNNNSNKICSSQLFKLQIKCDVLHDLVLFVQFKKREKHPWRSVNFSKK